MDADFAGAVARLRAHFNVACSSHEQGTGHDLLDTLTAAYDRVCQERDGAGLRLALLIERYHHDYCEHSDNPCECGWCRLKEEAEI